MLKGESLRFVQAINIGEKDLSRSGLDTVSALKPSEATPADLFNLSIADGLSPFEGYELQLLYQFCDLNLPNLPLVGFPTFFSTSTPAPMHQYDNDNTVSPPQNVKLLPNRLMIC
ncbi:hypothetical protein HPB50_018746 [Hyalomma asiaticum]|uniref:Uncharacterized protein n=1 Tax=Hyalomma asiaticum TaxID=266040 RepID=A0ACB7RRZ4_HYAAI|nr:hypothetical protein HPB50_018746 [Hyalomma asiaticum]